MTHPHSPSLDLLRERDRTRPDHVVFTPASFDGSTGDTGNEHFFVFPHPEHDPDSLLAVWTQSTQEHENDHRAVIARSTDGGATWSAPQCIAGDDGTKSSWAFPVVTAAGRIYVFYYRRTDPALGPERSPRALVCKYSDDAGRTWSDEGIVPVPRTPWDSPDPTRAASWLVWQRPERLSEGKPFVGITRWVGAGVLPPRPIKSWIADPAVVDFVRFENIDDHPPAERIELRFMCSGDDALKVGMEGYPEHPVAQEPSLVPLPDGRLFCVVRTIAGSPYYSVSEDAGKTWRAPEVLRRGDGGEPLLHPLSPCPIYATAQGDFFLLIHNHDQWLPVEGDMRRNPLYLVRGEFRAEARQPIWFSEPHLFMDTDSIPIGYQNRVNGLAMYSSVTCHGERTVLWYPDRKFYLLGKAITRQMMDEMAVPK